MNILEELRFMDEVDKITILAVGEKGTTEKRVHNIAFLFSKVLKIDIDAIVHENGAFSEAVFEKLRDERMRAFIHRDKKKIKLTEDGLQIYRYLLSRLESEKVEVAELLKALYKMSNKDLVSTITYLFPDKIRGEKE